MILHPDMQFRLSEYIVTVLLKCFANAAWNTSECPHEVGLRRIWMLSYLWPSASAAWWRQRVSISLKGKDVDYLPAKLCTGG